MNTCARPFSLTLLLALGLLLLVSARLQAAPDSEWQAAGSLLKSGEYSAALEAANQALEDAPDHIVLLRIKGVALMELGREDEAVAVLHHAVETDPGSISCWYYLAQALAYRGSVGEAVRILEQIRKVAPDSEYARLANQVLPELRTLIVVEEVVQDSNRWNVTLRLAGEYDDNVPARPDDGPAAPTTESFRLVTSAFIEARPLDQKLDEIPVTLSLGYGVYQSFHERDVWRTLDLTSHSVQATLKRDGRLGNTPFQCAIGGAFNAAQLDGDEFSRSAGANAAFTIQWADWAESGGGYDIQWNEFEDDGLVPSLGSRDGKDLRVHLRQRFFLCENRLVLTGGYLYRHSDTDGSNFDLNSHGAIASVQLVLPWDVVLGTDFTYQSEDYTEFTPAPSRLDDVYSVRVSMSRRLLCDDLTAELSYSHTTSDSTQSAANYERNIYGVAIVFSY